jgi:acylphosphatase
MAPDVGRGMTRPGELPQRLQATVRGSVQGVGFRWFIVRAATSLGLSGWTANERDGSVRVVAEGSATALDSLEAQLREGPRAARVTAVEAVRTQPTGEFDSFGVRAGSHDGD